MSELHIEELSASNISAANALDLKPGQEQYVTPVSYSAAAAVNDPNITWQRVVMDGNDVVGFIMGSFDPHADDEFRSILWRVNVDAGDQGRGVGRFAVDALAEEARKRGHDKLFVIWELGEEGPQEFFLHAGFTPIGETAYGEVLGAMEL
jgi:diamine N-acetyltransferase